MQWIRELEFDALDCYLRIVDIGVDSKIDKGQPADAEQFFQQLARYCPLIVDLMIQMEELHIRQRELVQEGYLYHPKKSLPKPVRKHSQLVMSGPKFVKPYWNEDACPPHFTIDHNLFFIRHPNYLHALGGGDSSLLEEDDDMSTSSRRHQCITGGRLARLE